MNRGAGSPRVAANRLPERLAEHYAGFFTFLLVVQALVATALITFILMQRSEGGGLAGGGSPAGMMSARGAADFLTRGTAILATIFVALSILLAALAAGARTGRDIDPNIANQVAPAAPAAPAAAGPAPAAGHAAPRARRPRPPPATRQRRAARPVRRGAARRRPGGK